MGEILLFRLEHRGLYAGTATSVDDALQYLEANHVDGILLDVKMPNIDSITAFELFKEHWKNIVITMISGHANMEVAANVLRLGLFLTCSSRLTLVPFIIKLKTPAVCMSLIPQPPKLL